MNTLQPAHSDNMLDLISLTEQLSEESRMGAPMRQAFGITSRHDWVHPESPSIILPDVLTTSRPLADILQQRRAVRSYTEQPISRRALATVLCAASDADREDWPEEQNDTNLELLVVAWRVENLAPATYVHEPANHSLVCVAAAPDQRTEGEELVLQTEFAKASAIVLIVGALGAALARHGARGHQKLLFRAGSAGQRMWLAALAVGLEGTVFAGFLPRATQRLAGVDGYRRAGLFAFAMGAIHSQT